MSYVHSASSEDINYSYTESCESSSFQEILFESTSKTLLVEKDEGHLAKNEERSKINKGKTVSKRKRVSEQMYSVDNEDPLELPPSNFEYLSMRYTSVSTHHSCIIHDSNSSDCLLRNNLQDDRLEQLPSTSFQSAIPSLSGYTKLKDYNSSTLNEPEDQVFMPNINCSFQSPSFEMKDVEHPFDNSLDFERKDTQELDLSSVCLEELDDYLFSSSSCSPQRYSENSFEDLFLNLLSEHDCKFTDITESTDKQQTSNLASILHAEIEKVKTFYLPRFWELFKQMREVNEMLVNISILKGFSSTIDRFKRLLAYRSELNHFNLKFEGSTTALVNSFRPLVNPYFKDLSSVSFREISSPYYYKNLSRESKEEFKRVLATIIVEGKLSLLENVLAQLGESKIWMDNFKHKVSSKSY